MRPKPPLGATLSLVTNAAGDQVASYEVPPAHAASHNTPAGAPGGRRSSRPSGGRGSVSGTPHVRIPAATMPRKRQRVSEADAALPDQPTPREGSARTRGSRGAAVVDWGGPGPSPLASSGPVVGSMNRSGGKSQRARRASNVWALFDAEEGRGVDVPVEVEGAPVWALFDAEEGGRGVDVPVEVEGVAAWSTFDIAEGSGVDVPVEVEGLAHTRGSVERLSTQSHGKHGTVGAGAVTGALEHRGSPRCPAKEGPGDLRRGSESGSQELSAMQGIPWTDLDLGTGPSSLSSPRCTRGAGGNCGLKDSDPPVPAPVLVARQVRTSRAAEAVSAARLGPSGSHVGATWGGLGSSDNGRTPGGMGATTSAAGQAVPCPDHLAQACSATNGHMCTLGGTGVGTAVARPDGDLKASPSRKRWACGDNHALGAGLNDAHTPLQTSLGASMRVSPALCKQCRLVRDRLDSPLPCNSAHCSGGGAPTLPCARLADATPIDPRADGTIRPGGDPTSAQCRGRDAVGPWRAEASAQQTLGGSVSRDGDSAPSEVRGERRESGDAGFRWSGHVPKKARTARTNLPAGSRTQAAFQAALHHGTRLNMPCGPGRGKSMPGTPGRRADFENPASGGGSGLGTSDGRQVKFAESVGVSGLVSAGGKQVTIADPRSRGAEEMGSSQGQQVTHPGPALPPGTSPRRRAAFADEPCNGPCPVELSRGRRVAFADEADHGPGPCETSRGPFAEGACHGPGRLEASRGQQVTHAELAFPPESWLGAGAPTQRRVAFAEDDGPGPSEASRGRRVAFAELGASGVEAASGINPFPESFQAVGYGPAELRSRSCAYPLFGESQEGGALADAPASILREEGGRRSDAVTGRWSEEGGRAAVGLPGRCIDERGSEADPLLSSDEGGRLVGPLPERSKEGGRGADPLLRTEEGRRAVGPLPDRRKEGPGAETSSAKSNEEGGRRVDEGGKAAKPPKKRARFADEEPEAELKVPSAAIGGAREGAGVKGAGHGVDEVMPEAGAEEVLPGDEGVLSKQAEQGGADGACPVWVLCDLCLKWREVPAECVVSPLSATLPALEKACSHKQARSDCGHL
jgi:hypothetical protein